MAVSKRFDRPVVPAERSQGLRRQRDELERSTQLVVSLKSSMAKAGDAYEAIVGEVQRALDPGATVHVGVWVHGPDGRRDMDVSVHGTKNGAPHFTLIECKDWSHPVGIAVVDALDSKQRDLGANAAVICSNSGFTDDALRKAARVQISMAAAMAAGDSRIRMHVQRDFIARRRDIDRWSVTVFPVENQDNPGPFTGDDLVYEGEPLVNWMSRDTSRLLSELGDSIGQSVITVDYLFRDSCRFVIKGQPVLLRGMAVRLECSMGFVHQFVTEDVTLGQYDFLTASVTIPDKHAYVLGSFDSHAWRDTNVPPNDGELQPGSFRVDLVLMKGIETVPDAGMPSLDDVVAKRSVSIQKSA